MLILQKIWTLKLDFQINLTQSIFTACGTAAGAAQLQLPMSGAACEEAAHSPWIPGFIQGIPVSSHIPMG